MPDPIHIHKFSIGNNKPLTLIAGVNVVEDLTVMRQVARQLLDLARQFEINLIFKASFDKANRSSITSYRGVGMEQGLERLREIKKEFDIPLISDIHEPWQAKTVTDVLDLVQIPAFLCRQTDLLEAAAKTGKPLHVKKMQMMAPWDMKNVVQKLEEFGCRQILLGERGTSFGYNNLVVDPLSFPELKKFGYPIVFDVTHSLQKPGGLGSATAGRGEYVYDLAKVGVSQGIAALFVETHPDPKIAKCDGPCAIPLRDMERLLKTVVPLDKLVKTNLA